MIFTVDFSVRGVVHRVNIGADSIEHARQIFKATHNMPGEEHLPAVDSGIIYETEQYRPAGLVDRIAR